MIQRIASVLYMFLLTVSLPLFVGCGKEEQPNPREIIDGTWIGSFISEGTEKERSFEAILCYGEDPDILPPYYYDFFRKSAKITGVSTTLVGVHGVFKIQSNDQVDTLVVNGGFSFEWGLNLELDEDISRSAKYRLMNGMISDNRVDGSYEEFGFKDGDRFKVDTGMWNGIRILE